jgi:hypothetical protein
MHFKGKTYQPTIPHKDLYAGQVDRERLLGRVEGALVGQWAEHTGLGLRECYRLCGIPDKEAVLAGHAIKDWNKKKVHMRGGMRSGITKKKKMLLTVFTRRRGRRWIRLERCCPFGVPFGPVRMERQ